MIFRSAKEFRTRPTWLTLAGLTLHLWSAHRSAGATGLGWPHSQCAKRLHAHHGDGATESGVSLSFIHQQASVDLFMQEAQDPDLALPHSSLF
jgi:hypothetical protein